jgi:uncharacterized membrane protein
MDFARSLHERACRSRKDRLSVRAAMAVVGGASLAFWGVLAGVLVYLFG